MTQALVKLSASQLASHKRCPRRWWFERNRPRGPEHPSAAYGSRVHDALEDWHTYGTALDPSTPEGRTAISGLDLQPPPLHAQAEFAYAMPHGPVLYNGRIDLAYGYRAREHVVVADHKTTSDFRYAKNTEELAEDAQRILYARYAATRYGVAQVTARWIYYRRETARRKPAAMAVELTESAEQIEERFLRLHEHRSLPILRDRQRHPSEIPRNFAACGLFPPDGCPFRRECHATADPVERAAGALGLC